MYDMGLYLLDRESSLFIVFWEEGPMLQFGKAGTAKIIVPVPV